MNSTLRRWTEIDHRLSAQAAGIVRGRLSRRCATAAAHSGDSLLWLVGGALLWRFGSGAWATAGERIVILNVLTWIVITALKHLFRRSRPSGERGLFYLAMDRHSFPSGHATRVAGLMVVLGGLLPASSAAGVVLWGLAVCLSRVALGLHFLADVAAGLAIGFVLGGLLLAFGL